MASVKDVELHTLTPKSSVKSLAVPKHLVDIPPTPVRPDKPTTITSSGNNNNKDNNQHEHIHKKGCEDKLRCEFFGHEWHWSEIFIFLCLVGTIILGCLKQLTGSNDIDNSIFWLLVMIACGFGNIFLWNIGWVQTDAEYSRRIDWACKDIEKENETMLQSVNELKRNLKEQEKLATDAARQTAAMGKKVGLVDEHGKVIKEGVKKFENLMNSPHFTSYNIRLGRTQKIQNETNNSYKRDNMYNDCIRNFKTSASGGVNAKIKIKDERVKKRLARTFNEFNKKCVEVGSLPIDINKLDQMDNDGDEQVDIWEFCIYIYHNILRIEIGGEVEQVEKMETECEKMKQRIQQIDQEIHAIKNNLSRDGNIDVVDVEMDHLAFKKID